MTSLVDLHCHLDLYPDYEKLFEECENEKIYTLTVTTTPRAWPRNFELTKNKKYVRAALGLHPQLVTQYGNDLELWEEYFSQAKYIGEIGLDAGPAYYKSLEQQTKIFDYIISRCADVKGKVLTIHSIRTGRQILEILRKYQATKNNKVILHWFSGTITQAKEALKLGCYFSVNTQMLNNPRNHELLNEISLNRLVTETDGPFTSVNNKPQKPRDVSICVQMIASILKYSEEEIKNQILLNLKEILNTVT